LYCTQTEEQAGTSSILKFESEGEGGRHLHAFQQAGHEHTEPHDIEVGGVLEVHDVAEGKGVVVLRAIQQGRLILKT
jgi:hypothetical protein